MLHADEAGDLCKPHASLSAQWSGTLRWLLPRKVWPYLDTGLGHFLLLMLVIAPLLAALFGLLYHQELQAQQHVAVETLRATFLKAYCALLLVAGIVSWWLVLAHKSRQVAQEESNRQTHLLVLEIESHRQTDEALQQARQAADQARHAAEHANHAKSRYISAISHELRTPLNSILGYAQLMGEDAAIPAHRKHAVHVIKRGGEHLLSLIEGTLDIARIESGKLTLNVRPSASPISHDSLAAVRAAGGGGAAVPFRGRAPCPRWCAPTRSACARFSSTCWATRSSSRPRARSCSASGMRARWPRWRWRTPARGWRRRNWRRSSIPSPAAAAPASRRPAPGWASPSPRC